MFVKWLYSDMINHSVYNTTKYDKHLELIDMYNSEIGRVRDKVEGVRIYPRKDKISFVPFIIIKGKHTNLPVQTSHDESVKIRIKALCENVDDICKNGLKYYDPYNKVFKLTYTSLDDGLITFIESNLQGQVLTHTKLPQTTSNIS